MIKNETGVGILKTRQHFAALDGMRGVAALAVVTFHFMEMAIYDSSKNFIGHGYLAVDFFFCLSGFVIGYAYDDRIGRMGLVEFLKSRLIRLHPLVVFGSILGLLAFLFDPFAAHPSAYSAGRLALIFLASIFVIPFPVMAERAHNNFSFNAPAWSLFWEYVANLFFAVLLWRIGRRSLLVLTIVSAALLGYIGYQHHSLAGGWNDKTFWDGGARVAFSFSAGLLIYRFGWRLRTRLGFTGLSILLLAAFLTPFIKGWWASEPLIVVFYFPLLVALGAGASLTKRSEEVCSFFGKMSYPLYMTHYSVIWIFGNYWELYKPGMMRLVEIVTCGVLLLTGFAYVVMVAYDIPVRRYLSSRRAAALMKQDEKAAA